jgi:uroporphyrinogen decarboxylase
MNPLQRLLENLNAKRLAMPIAVYPGASLVNVNVQEIVSDPEAQVATAIALHRRYNTAVVMSAMDLSVEAQAFGCEVMSSPTEVPSVAGKIIHNFSDAQALKIPTIGSGRTNVYLQTVKKLKRFVPQAIVLGGCIGPFSLAGRLIGLSEALANTINDPPLLHCVLEKCTDFLISYLNSFKENGADGVIMAEPAAGLLSPRSMTVFSSNYISKIIKNVDSSHFFIILHNCAARPVHLDAKIAANAQIYHFGPLMEMPAALRKVNTNALVCGNLDPTSVFVQSTPEQIKNQTHELLELTKTFKNFIISSGCDIPPSAPISNIDAFFEEVQRWNGLL